MTTGSLVVLVGPKGSGKSYIGDLLSRELGVTFLRVEPIFLETIAQTGLAGAALEREGFARVLARLETMLGSDAVVVMESTGAAESFPAFLAQLRARHRVSLVAIRAPLEICAERVRTRDQTVHIPVSDDRVAEINARASLVELPWELEIDNCGPAPQETLLALFKALLERAAP